MIIYVEKKASWMQWITPETFADADLFRIVTFFVFHSPCEDLSSMCKPLAEYGWTAPWKKPFYLNKQLKQLSGNYELLFSASSYDSLEIALEKAGLKDNFPSKLNQERICIYDNMENQFRSVFWHLRNCFAHCRLNMTQVDGECVFILEDGVPKKGSDLLRLSARMIIRKSTLLKWIDLIEGGEKEYIESIPSTLLPRRKISEKE